MRVVSAGKRRSDRLFRSRHRTWRFLLDLGCFTLTDIAEVKPNSLGCLPLQGGFERGPVSQPPVLGERRLARGPSPRQGADVLGDLRTGVNHRNYTASWWYSLEGSKDSM